MYHDRLNRSTSASRYGAVAQLIVPASTRFAYGAGRLPGMAVCEEPGAALGAVAADTTARARRALPGWSRCCRESA